ncbi:hypothetical protein [Enterobacter roggenkampii]|uniref:hypothetical protein n=1 Tax=Enterobacter roggenkampii TaxID=1812935 RepID=UPI00403F005E
MKKFSDYSAKQQRENNFGNNYITIEGMLSAPFSTHTEEHFKKCLETVPKINELMIDKNKCDNEQHYQEVKMMADVLLSMAMIERRLGMVKN